MSIILKGVDMPKGYGHIHLEIYPNGDVEAEWDQDSKDYRAIQIPKDHGRLIDADEFKSWVDDWYDCTDIGNIVESWIDERPTILDKERE